jgi:hypothetical protein
MAYTNGEVMLLANNITTLLSNVEKRPSAYAYALMINNRRLQNIVRYIQEIVDQQTPEFKPLNDAMRELRKDFTWMQNGQTILAPDGFPFIIPNKANEYDAACRALIAQTEGWQEIFNQRLAIMRDIQQLPCDDFKPYMIPPDKLPNEIAPAEMSKIEFMVHVPAEPIGAEVE